MENVSQSSPDETLRLPHPVTKVIEPMNGWLRFPFAAIPTASRLTPIAYSFADQALAVGGSFLVNVMLARTQTKEEYGMFALSYSVFTFLTGLYNAAILEPYTVYGSGRYRDRFSEYLWLIARSHVSVCMLLSGIVLLACLVFLRIAPHFVSRSLLGLGVTVGVLLSGVFMRRVFYLQRQPALAAKSSLVFFLTVACGLWLTTKAHRLDSFSVFLILALGWIAGAASFGRKLAFGTPKQAFLELEPRYWREHWNYAQWVLATAFVFQFTTQGFYWLVAGVLSVEEVAKLRAMYNLVAPVDQVLIAMSFLVLPMLSRRSASCGMAGLLPLWKAYCAGCLLVTGVFAACVNLFGKPVMHFLYAGNFDDVAPLLGSLALLPVVMGIGNAMNAAIKAVEKPKLVFYTYVCSGSTTVLLGVPLVTHFGLQGVVYGMLLSATAYTVSLTTFFLWIVSSSVADRPESLACERVPGGAEQEP